MESQFIKTSLRDYFRVLCYWKGTVIILFFVISLTAFLGSFLLPPVYEAFTLVLVEREPKSPVLHKEYSTATIPPQLSVTEERTELAKTQSEIIKSRQILEGVALDFGLDKEFDGKNQIEKAVSSLQERIEVKLKEETNIIKLSVEDKDPQLAARLANAIAEKYVNWLSEAKRVKTKGASGVLSERIKILDRELKETENKLELLKKKGDVAALEEEMSITVAKLADFNAEYEHTVAGIEEKRARLKELEEDLGKEELATLLEGRTNPVVDALKLKLLDLELKRTELLSKYKEDSSPLEGIDEKIAQAKAELRNEVAKQMTNVKNELTSEIITEINLLEADLAALQARKKVMEDARRRYSDRLRQLADIEVEYKRLEREVKGKNELYLSLLGKQAEASLTEAIESSLLINVKVLDPAKIPLKPIRPKKILNTVLGCIVGLMSGVGGAFLKEYWDHSLKTVDEIKRYLDFPTLATIPRAKQRQDFTLYAPGSPISESFHVLSTSVQQLCKEHGINTLLVASPNYGEGKSVICANLAVSLASIEGKKVLIVDTNMRQPAMHKFFEVNLQSDLVEILSQGKPIKPDQTDIKNIHLISTAHEISEPSRLLALDSVKEFVNAVKPHYDYIIFDSPALIPYPDASILGFECEGIIMVVEFGQTRRETVERAKSLLNKSQRKILGAVLNNVEYVIPSILYKRL